MSQAEMARTTRVPEGISMGYIKRVPSAAPKELSVVAIGKVIAVWTNEISGTPKCSMDWKLRTTLFSQSYRLLPF
jgi:hypothetical protein